MGPRIYPSYQDTNTTAVGSIIISTNKLPTQTQNLVQVYINGIVTRPYYGEYNGLYSRTIQLNDTIRIIYTTIPLSTRKWLDINRLDYTTDDVSGNLGIVNNFIYETNTTGSTLDYTFTATTSLSSYNFEYKISTYTTII
jgi:hypothetical protein